MLERPQIHNLGAECGMTKRWKVILGLTGACVLLAGLIPLYQATRPGLVFPKEQLDQLRSGMTPAEAEEVLGVPPGVYTSRELGYHLELPAPGEMRWQTDTGVLCLTFHDGRVFQQIFCTPRRDTWFDRLRRWLGV
jgi:hypothetical protein